MTYKDMALWNSGSLKMAIGTRFQQHHAVSDHNDTLLVNLPGKLAVLPQSVPRIPHFGQMSYPATLEVRKDAVVLLYAELGHSKQVH